MMLIKHAQWLMKSFVILLGVLSIAGTSAANENLHMELFRGRQIAPYVDAMAKLAVTTYKEPPYLYDGSIDSYRPFFQNYANSASGVACLLFDGNQVVGMAAGVGLDKARDFYQQPFSSKGYDLRTFYNPGEVLVLKEYRGKGYGAELYKNLENVVKTMPQFQYMTFCTYPDNWSIKDNLEDTNEAFWKSEGFSENKNIFVILDWVDIGKKMSTPHKLYFWVKRLR